MVRSHSALTAAGRSVSARRASSSMVMTHVVASHTPCSSRRSRRQPRPAGRPRYDWGLVQSWYGSASALRTSRPAPSLGLQVAFAVDQSPAGLGWHAAPHELPRSWHRLAGSKFDSRGREESWLPTSPTCPGWASWRSWQVCHYDKVTEETLGEEALLAQGLDQLRSILGDGWVLEPYNLARPVGGNDVTDSDSGVDMVWSLRSATGGRPVGQVLVEAKADLTPAVAERVLAPQINLMRRLHGQAAVLIISPWLSPRTRQTLDQRGFGYLDLAGNISFKLNQPAVFIRTEGARRSPKPPQRRRRGLAGASARKLVRVLVDYCPPYQANGLAKEAGISLSYVSRLLDTMADEALIRREDRLIVDADWVGLLRATAEIHKLPLIGKPWLARKGLNSVLEALRDGQIRHQAVVTGHVAAQAIAPTAIGGELILYIPPGPHVLDEIGKDLSLLEVPGVRELSRAPRLDQVLTLVPSNNGPFERTMTINGLEQVGLSQLVLDCFAGSGRMPAEGEAVLAYMIANEEEWRLPSLLSHQSNAVV